MYNRATGRPHSGTIASRTCTAVAAFFALYAARYSPHAAISTLRSLTYLHGRSPRAAFFMGLIAPSTTSSTALFQLATSPASQQEERIAACAAPWQEISSKCAERRPVIDWRTAPSGLDHVVSAAPPSTSPRVQPTPGQWRRGARRLGAVLAMFMSVSSTNGANTGSATTATAASKHACTAPIRDAGAGR